MHAHPCKYGMLAKSGLVSRNPETLLATPLLVVYQILLCIVHTLVCVTMVTLRSSNTESMAVSFKQKHLTMLSIV